MGYLIPNEFLDNLLFKIGSLIDKEDYVDINKNITNISRENLINIIGIIRNNKYKFKSASKLELYNKIIDGLYNNISIYKVNTSNINYYKSNYETIHSNIKTSDDLVKSIYLNCIIENIPGLQVLIDILNNKTNIEQNQFKLQIIPNEDIEFTQPYNKFMISSLNLMMQIFIHFDKLKRIIISITLFDYIFRNFNFVKNNKKFGKAVVDKLKEFINLNLDDIIPILKKYYNNENALIIWTTYVENFT
jgi:hypothetical protein